MCTMLHLPPLSQAMTPPSLPGVSFRFPLLMCTEDTTVAYTSSPCFHSSIYSAGAPPWLLYLNTPGCGALAVSNHAPSFLTLSNEHVLGKVMTAGLSLKVTGGGDTALCVPGRWLSCWERACTQALDYECAWWSPCSWREQEQSRVTGDD